MKLEYIKDLIQSCNIDFLIGSGLSSPYLSTLGNIEILLTELEEKKPDKKIYNLIKASLYKTYCENVIFRNLKSEINKYKLEKSDKSGKKITKYAEYLQVSEDYKHFLLNLNEILLYRHNNLLTKQVNIFTTNIDILLETAVEQTGLEFNDGFKGRIKPVYDLSNFHKSYSKTSSHYNNIFEIPVFNILKIHGSINWEKRNKNKIIYTSSLGQVKKIKKELDKIIPSHPFFSISNNSTFEEFLDKANKKRISDKLDFKAFLSEYSKLLIVNPAKEKFERTVFDEQFYELLRIYANELEKENTILFVMGFSFADEHIKHITVRAANSNPTLQVVVFAYSEEDLKKISNELSNIKNNNINILSPQLFINANLEKDEEKEANVKTLKERLKNFDCKSLNQEIFGKIKDMVV